MTYQVYKIKDQFNNVIYIGVTKTTKGYKKRFKEHQQEALRDGSSLLHQRMKKDGINNFTCILMLHDIPEDKIEFYEQLWIFKYNTYYQNNDLGCNMTLGGGGSLGYSFNDEIKNKISSTLKLYYEKLKLDSIQYDNLCKQRSESLKGIPKSEAHKNHISKSRIEKGIAKGEKNPFYGKQHTEETKQKIAIANGLAVIMKDINTETELKRFDSASQAAEYLISIQKTTNKFANARILWVCHGVAKTAYGFKWSFDKV